MSTEIRPGNYNFNTPLSGTQIVEMTECDAFDSARKKAETEQDEINKCGLCPLVVVYESETGITDVVGLCEKISS